MQQWNSQQNEQGAASITINGGFFWGQAGSCDDFPNSTSIIGPGSFQGPFTFNFTVNAQSNYCFAEGTLYGSAPGAVLSYTYAFPPVSQATVTGPATDGPIPLWAIGALGLCLIAIARKRINFAS